MDPRHSEVAAVVLVGCTVTFICAAAGYPEAAGIWAAGTALEAFLAARRT